MRQLTAICLVGILTVACSTPAPDAPPVDEGAEKAAVEAMITEWFVSGLAQIDTAAVGRSLTPDFEILEDSVWYDRAGFLEFVASLPAMVGVPFTLTYDLSDWRTTVHNDVAWTSMRNRAVLQPENVDPIPLDWRETVVLRKLDGRWLIARYHSAPVR